MKKVIKITLISLLVVIVIGLLFLIAILCFPTPQFNALPPMIQVDGNLYFEQGVVPKLPEDAVLIGKIESVVPNHESPKSDMQANFGSKGTQVYRCSDTILIPIIDSTQWSTFERR